MAIKHKIENPQHRIRIADVDISLECDRGSINLKDVFKPAESEPKKTKRNIEYIVAHS